MEHIPDTVVIAGHIYLVLFVLRVFLWLYYYYETSV